MSDHNTRVRECSDKFLEQICSDPEHELYEEAKKEVGRRASSKPNCRAIRAAKRERAMEKKLEKASHHQQYSGDPRKIKGK